MTDKISRCDWLTSDQVYINYHDFEWGVPLHDDTKFFELLVLEGAQAGLSWLTVLKRRKSYKTAFDNFDPKIVSNYNQSKIDSLIKDDKIIRNKLKINSAITNAKAFLAVQNEFKSFDNYIWKFVDNKQITHNIKLLTDYPTSNEQSKLLSLDLLKRGFKFVGPTICYALMQSAGLINDHQLHCFRYQETISKYACMATPSKNVLWSAK